MTKLKRCLTSPNTYSEYDPKVPSFKTAIAVKKFLTDSWNNKQFNTTDKFGDVGVKYNYYQMPDKEIKKFVIWANKNICKSEAVRMSYEECIIKKRIAKLKIKLKEFK